MKNNSRELNWMWESFLPETYAAEIQDYVHFSVKTVNSNAEAGGVRLAPEDGLGLPYVCARTLIESGYTIPLDYASNSGKAAKIMKQVQAFDAGQAGPDDDTEAESIKGALRHAHATRQEIDTGSVSVRARQLLLPREDGYVAVTPLGAAGLCRIVNAQVDDYQARSDEHNATLKEQIAQIRSGDDTAKTGETTRFRPRLALGHLGIGGANPQNVGALVREMQRPLVFFAPRIDNDLRAALAIYYKGISLRPARRLMDAYRAWHLSHGGTTPTDRDSREAEQAHLTAIVAELNARAEHARQRLWFHRHHLPQAGDPLVSPDLPAEVRGLIDPTQRAVGWKNDTAALIARQVADFSFGEHQEGFMFDQRGLDTLARWIVEALA